MERELVRAVLADEALIALTGYDRNLRSTVLDRAETQLLQHECRIVRVRAVDGHKLDLKTAMDQVVGPGPGSADRVERFFNRIALPVGQERHIVLIVEDAQTIGSDLLSYLSLIGPTTATQDVRLQIVFAGEASMWDRLPRRGSLAIDQILSRSTIGRNEPPRKILPKHEPEAPESESPAATPLPKRVRPSGPQPPPAMGHEALRYRMAVQYRRQMRIHAFTARATKILVVIVVVFGSVILWTEMPELRTDARQWAANMLAPRPPPPISATIAALVVRGNWLLAHGDVKAARSVFENAALSGDVAAVLGLAKANDPIYLAKIGLRNTGPDERRAMELYRRAAALGDREAIERLSRGPNTTRH